jgi:exopolysaccharide biosynthesis WecB/TagA/CpsF family protein
MKILIVSQYFWPENFRVNNIAAELAKKGHQVEVLTGEPNYPGGFIDPEYLKNKTFYKSYLGCKIHRVKTVSRKSGKNYQIFINYFSFFINASIYILRNFRKNNFDVVFTFGTSPVTVSILSFYPCFKKSKKIIWVLDLWPEILYELKIVNNFLYKLLLNKLVKYIYNKNDLILAQSKSFQKKIRQLVNNKKKVKVLYSWPEQISEKICRKNLLDKKKKIIKNFSKKFKKDHLNILFTGNVGWAQNFSYISNMIKELDKDFTLKVAWHILGSGRDYERSKKNLYLYRNVYFYKPVKFEVISNFHDLADVLLISLYPGNALNSTIPGKFQTYLFSQKPILGSISGECAYFIKKYNLGLSSNPGDSESFKKHVKEFYIKKINGKLYINNIKELKKIFSYKKLINFFNNQIEQLIKKSDIIKLKMVQDFSFIPCSKNFILSALNLAFLGYFAAKRFEINNNFYVWPDGIFFKKIFKKKNIYKIPGREILKKMNVPKNIKYIHLLGNSHQKGISYIKKKFPNKKILHTKLPYASAEKLYKFVPKLKKNELTLLLLPTPKQEKLAILLSKKNKNYKIICIGGALNMLAGIEKPAPNLIEKINLEFIWRLRYDSIRRVIRLTHSGVLFFKYLILGSYKKIQGIYVK